MRSAHYLQHINEAGCPEDLYFRKLCPPRRTSKLVVRTRADASSPAKAVRSAHLAPLGTKNQQGRPGDPRTAATLQRKRFKFKGLRSKLDCNPLSLKRLRCRVAAILGSLGQPSERNADAQVCQRPGRVCSCLRQAFSKLKTKELLGGARGSKHLSVAPGDNAG